MSLSALSSRSIGHDGFPGRAPARFHQHDAPTPEERTRLLENAVVLLESEDFVLARGIYSFLLRTNRQDSEALRGMGECFLAMGNTASARRCFEALPKARFRDERHCLLARCHVTEGNDRLALEEFESLESPDNLATRLLLPMWRSIAACFAREGEWEQAVLCYRAAIELRPGCGSLFAAWGLLELERGHLDDAAAQMRRAVSVTPTSARVHYAMAMLHLRREDFESAEESLIQALTFDPMHVSALFELLSVSEQLGRWEHARDYLLRFLEKDPSNEAIRFAVAAVRVRLGDWNGARADLQFLLSALPEDGRALELLQAIEAASAA